MTMSNLLTGLTCIRGVFSPTFQVVRHLDTYKSKNMKKLGPRPSKKLEAYGEALKSKGFLRSNKPYDPPSDVSSKVEAICTNAGLPVQHETVFDDPVQRFNVLKECHIEFNHSIPNSQLCCIETVGDLLNFYETAVITTSPFDALKTTDLPKNIHVQYEYMRFHPDTDTMFNGLSAFPKTSCLVSGISTRKKYAGFTARSPWNEVSRKT